MSSWARSSWRSISSCKSGYLICCILSVRTKSLRPAHIQGRRIKSPPTDGKTVKEFANIFWNHHRQHLWITASRSAWRLQPRDVSCFLILGSHPFLLLPFVTNSLDKIPSVWYIQDCFSFPDGYMQAIPSYPNSPSELNSRVTCRNMNYYRVPRTMLGAEHMSPHLILIPALPERYECTYLTAQKLKLRKVK